MQTRRNMIMACLTGVVFAWLSGAVRAETCSSQRAADCAKAVPAAPRAAIGHDTNSQARLRLPGLRDAGLPRAERVTGDGVYWTGDHGFSRGTGTAVGPGPDFASVMRPSPGRSGLLGERLDWAMRNATGTPDRAAPSLAGSYLLNQAASVNYRLGRDTGDAMRRFDSPALLGPALLSSPGTDVDRTILSLSINAVRQFGAFGLGAHAGYIDTRERLDHARDATAADIRLAPNRGAATAQRYFGVDARYGLSRSWQLHGSAFYRRDFGRDPGASASAFGLGQSFDRDEREWVVGVRFYGGRNFKLNFEYLNTSGRDQFRNEAFTLTGRFDF